MSDPTIEARPAGRRMIRSNPARDRGEIEFQRARRRTRLVRWLRIVLPAIAVIAVAGYLITMRVMNELGDIDISMSGLNLDTKSLTIEKPRVSGFKGTAQSYDLSAERAVQDLTNSKVVRLESISGSFGLQSDGSATMTAKTGVYDGNAETLLLTEGISVKTTTGYDVSLSEAALDFKLRTLTSATPVVIKTGEGTIHANSVRMSDGGRKIAFENGVTVTYMPSAGDGIAAPAADGDP
jgi:lipopolysaccharide export system protein LptC